MKDNIVSKLGFILSRRDKVNFFILVGLSITLALVETIGISAIMPFIAIATDFSRVLKNKYLFSAYRIFGFSTPQHFVIAFGIALIIFYIIRGAYNLFYFYMLARFSQGRYYLIAYKLLQGYLNFSYRDFTKHNTSTLTKNIINESSNVVSLLTQFLFVLSELFVAILLYTMLIVVNWKMTLLLTLFLAVNALFLMKTIGGKLKREGKKRVESLSGMFKTIEIAFGNFKLIKLLSQDKVILSKFQEGATKYTKTKIINQTLVQFPRLFLETMGFSIISFIVVYLVWKYNENITPMLGVLSMYVLALYRLLPSFNRILSGYNQIMFYKESLNVVHENLMYDVEKLGDEPVEFNRYIKMESVYFGYDNTTILENINLRINKGEKIAITGESGAGKTTLVDLIIGIYKPTKGKIKVDEIELTERNVKSWRWKIGYIPQQVFLFSGSVADNIVFGRELNEEKVKKCLEIVGMLEFFNRYDDIHTRIGPKGIMLSGGQQQRIAIARTIYSDPEVLVLDEATSALDYEAEQKIIDIIFKIGRELTVAHRHSALKRCNRTLLVENGRVKEM